LPRMSNVKQPVENLHRRLETLFFNSWMVDEVAGFISNIGEGNRVPTPSPLRGEGRVEGAILD